MACFLECPSFAQWVAALTSRIHSSTTDLSRFLSNFVDGQHLPEQFGTTVRGPWPAPSPLHWLGGPGHRPRSGRRRVRWCRNRALNVFTALIFGVSNALFYGLERLDKLVPRKWSSCRLGSVSKKIAEFWKEEVSDLSRVWASACTGGRLSLAKSIRACRPACPYDLHSMYRRDGSSGGSDVRGGSAPCDVRMLRADLLDLPDCGAVVPCKSWLSQSTLEKWCGPWLVARPGCAQPEPAFLCSRREWLKVLKRLKSCNLLAFIQVSAVACDPWGRVLRSGVFALVKSNGFCDSSLIVDLRTTTSKTSPVFGFHMRFVSHVSGLG